MTLRGEMIAGEKEGEDPHNSATTALKKIESRLPPIRMETGGEKEKVVKEPPGAIGREEKFQHPCRRARPCRNTRGYSKSQKGKTRGGERSKKELERVGKGSEAKKVSTESTGGVVACGPAREGAGTGGESPRIRRKIARSYRHGRRRRVSHPTASPVRKEGWGGLMQKSYP